MSFPVGRLGVPGSQSDPAVSLPSDPQHTCADSEESPVKTARVRAAAVALAIAPAIGLATTAPSPAIAESPPAGPPAAAPPATPADNEPDADYEPTEESLARHSSPGWFDDAKLGFFIHWGPYSVPAFAPPDGGGARDGSDVYAEWYWYEMNHPGSPTNLHHAQKYGEDFAYDDFVAGWKADRFDPEEWLDLFTEGGAKYFVMVSKHHDGVALWDSQTTQRDTVAMGPHRDLVDELFTAAKKYPLKTGLYYSLAEWYHPDGGWDPPAHSLEVGPQNPYTGESVPYTGHQPVDDVVMDHQYPQMKELVDDFDPDMFWCDIGEHVPDNSLDFMAYYYNQAQDRQRPKEVAVNDRCGPEHRDYTDAGVPQPAGDRAEASGRRREGSGSPSATTRRRTSRTTSATRS